MKISLSKIKIFIFSILFFIPEGMSTIGETNFITNALFLNNKIIHYIIKLLYWTRNIVGIAAIVIYILYRLYNVSYHRSKLKKVEASDILILFGIWVIFVSDRNNVNVYSVFILLSNCIGFYLISRKELLRDSEEYTNILLFVLTILLTINLGLAIKYPNGITTGKDYLSTPYYFFGTKNQTTPILLLMSMLSFLKVKYTKNKAECLCENMIIILNTFIMKSGTGLVCILLNLILNIFFGKKRLGWYNINNKNISILKKIVCCVIILMIGIVFFDLQKKFSWLIIDILKKDVTLSGRTFLWKKGIYQFFQKPFCGYGYGHKIDLGLYGHNLIIELMVTTGILGVSIYFLFLAKAFAGPEIARRGVISVPLICAAIALIVGNISEAFIYNISQMAILCYMAYASIRIKKLEE